MRSFGQEISGNRGKGRELTPEQRVSLISKSDAGCTQRELMGEFRCSRTCVQGTLRRWRNNKTVDSLPRGGRPKLLSHRDERLLIRTARKSPKIQYKELLKTARLLRPDHHPKQRTIYRILKRQGLTRYRCAKKPKLNTRHKVLRLKFSK
jgi:hypothetical protein